MKTYKSHLDINATKRILTALVLTLAVMFLCQDTVAAADTTPPTVSFTVPANAAGGVATDENIAAAFSEPMDPRTITKETFTLKRGAKKVPGKVSYVGVTATFEPAGNHLEPNTAYTAAITTGARDLAGNALASSFVWTFTTGATRDTTRPTVSHTVPDNAAIGVAVGGKILVTFTEPMDPDRKSTRLNSSHTPLSPMQSS